ncbi:MAG: DUF805 domain-containing protein [Candidatus Nanopelagicales bacterium]
MTVPPYDPPPSTAMPAGWYPDPAGPTTVRYWDGAAWTEHTAPRPYAAPVAVAAPPPQQGRAGVGIVEAVRLALCASATTAVAPARSEYWWFYLVGIVVTVVVSLVTDAAFPGTTVRGVYTSSDAAAGIQALVSIAGLVLGLPLSVRRLHDSGRAWPNLLFGLIPFVGWIIVLVFLCTGSERVANRWGPPPA